MTLHAVFRNSNYNLQIMDFASDVCISSSHCTYKLVTVMVSCSASLTVMRAFEQLCTGSRTNSCLQQARWELYVSCLACICLSVTTHLLSPCPFPSCSLVPRTHSRRRGYPSLDLEEDSLPNLTLENLPEVCYIYCLQVTHHTLSAITWHRVTVLWVHCICSCDITWLYYK